MYQKKDLCYSEVTPLLTATIQTLEHLSETRSGPMLTKFLKVTPQTPEFDKDGLCTFDYEGHTITDSVKQRTEAESGCTQFLNNMVKSLNSRFSDNSDGSVLTAMTPVFQSLKYCQTSDYLGTVGIEGSQSELLCFANFARASHNSGNKSVTDIHSAANLAIKNVNSYPASAEAAKRLLVSPVSTVDRELGFSRQNVIKTDLRNCLSVKNLENLLKISIEGKYCKDVDFKGIYKLWAGKKQRRILMK
ncbi:hypothetical protein DPMN_003058 [Dreissena polymorpha]|uniref:HAT C-terminal dimerisation domain-containing protein n=1 Tax=Dreissena polymorpha TaxID=45954 RepID=A0A9D4MMR6_DREPO|nr:hypothetical protein DPMN_003058 [Dreissena polymorpha]